jgi:hypothetical protein
MTTRNRPNYGIYYLTLTLAGVLDIPAIGTRVAMIGAYNGATITFAAGGGQQLSGGTPSSAIVGVQIGKALGDVLPFSVGNKVRVDNKFDFVRLSWSAQAGVTAIFAISDDAEGNGIEFDAPPSVTLGSLAIVQGGNTATVNGAGALNVDILQIGNNGPSLGQGDPTTTGSLRVYSGSKIGDSFANSNTGAGTTAVQLIAPGANVNGMIVRGNSTLFGTAGANIAVLAIGTVAPTTITSNENLLMAFGTQARLGEDVFIPAGQGLWALASVASGGSYNVSVKVL